MIKVKICGITSVEHALATAHAGADYLGLVFAPGKRRVDKNKAAEITAAIKNLEEKPLVAGVFVNLPADEINQTANYCRLDCVQLSGNESLEYCRDIELPIIKAVRIAHDSNPAKIQNEIEAVFSAGLKNRPVCLLDTKTGGKFGGTGKTFDWELARCTPASYPVMIAGGLSPDNICRLVETIQPWGVDVSTGVETAGQKDISKIKQFIKKVKNLDSKNYADITSNQSRQKD